MGTLDRLRSFFDSGLARELSSTDSMVLFALLRCADAKGRCHPSAGYLSRMLDTSERTVRRAFGRLQDAGAIVCVRPGGGRNRSTVWTIPMVFPHSGGVPGAELAIPEKPCHPGSKTLSPVSEEEEEKKVPEVRTYLASSPDMGVTPVTSGRVSGIMRPSGTDRPGPRHISEI